MKAFSILSVKYDQLIIIDIGRIFNLNIIILLINITYPQIN
jgi:hypothetical protein